MPATFGNRRLEEGLTPQGYPVPGEAYNMAQRYAISLAGIVIAIQTIPYGTNPILTVGQIATLSTTLRVGDKV